MKRLITLITIVFIVGCQNNSYELNYPQTRESDHVDTYHGVSVSDPYRWLEDDMSDETAEWVKAQNKITFNYLDKIRFRKKLKKRIITNLENQYNGQTAEIKKINEYRDLLNHDLNVIKNKINKNNKIDKTLLIFIILFVLLIIILGFLTALKFLPFVFQYDQ